MVEINIKWIQYSAAYQLGVRMESIDLISSKIDERNSIGIDDSFYIFHSDDVQLKYQKWMELIPRVTPFYAVKCNDDPGIVQYLAQLGTGFDCASIDELRQILVMGIEPHRIIYAHTIKQASHLKYAADNGVQMVTFDCSAELEKIKKIHPNAKVVLRIRFDAERSISCMGIKFGCDPVTEAPELIKRCKDLDMHLIGISFHVGTGTYDYKVYEKALQAVRRLFDVAVQFQYKLNLVDIGGGFMGNDMDLLGNYAKYINKGIDQYFADPSVTIISEPGRYFSASAFSLVVQVILKKISNDGHRHYFVNDSTYQSFLIAYQYRLKLQYKIIRKTGCSAAPFEYHSTIWGQTCCSEDKIVDSHIMPELEIDDHIVFENMGAYTTSLSSHFNGFQIGKIVDVHTKSKCF